MDAEQQVRLNFLEEADECCDRIEASILGISNSVADPSKLDLALRSSHSIKGGAAMMNYPILSQSAHRLEDFLKILRVRFSEVIIETSIESLVLASVDRLKDLTLFYKANQTIEDSWVDANIAPIFEQLHEKLGDLQDSDEDQLLNQVDEIDPALLVFEEGVDLLLTEFDSNLPGLEGEVLAAALQKTALELLNFGYMAELDPFIALCQSVNSASEGLSNSQLKDLAIEALAVWQRSHALVVRGKLDKLPSTLDLSETSPEVAISPEADVIAFEESLDALSVEDLMDLQAEFSPQSLHIEQPESSLEAVSDEEAFIANEAVETVEDPTEAFTSLEFDPELLESLQEEFEQQPAIHLVSEEQTPVEKRILEPIIPVPDAKPLSSGRTVKVSADQLYQFNSIFSRVVLERNSVILRLEQMKQFSELLQKRMAQLSQSNTQMRKWYDRASLEGVIPTPSNSAIPSSVNIHRTSSQNIAESFDALEMDQYSDLHIISQSQLETVVQLQEVTADIDTGLRAMEKAVQDLNTSTQLLQKNVTQTQMMPFGDAVKRFPRVIRDLNLKYQKSVNLIIEGQSTQIDRAIIDSLTDALLQLLRNAFDHGIEDEAERRSLGKAANGTIRLRAENLSNETVITLEDDGSGIKLNKIRDRLINLGLETGEIDLMPQEDLLNIIFEPGFSTAGEVTEVSGRGVGMDVVRNNLREVRGDVKVETVEGKGTTFSLTVPYSLSIMKVLLMERGNLFFAIPIDAVREIISLPNDDCLEQKHFSWNNQDIPIITLENFLQYQGPRQRFEMTGSPVINRATLVIVGRDDTLSAIALDRFWGEQEVTIRPVSKALPLPAGFNSSMVMGDGRVLPLINPTQLIDWCQTQTPQTQNNIPSKSSFSRDQEPTILVVDDSINVRNFLTLTLEKAGYRVEQARDGQDAVTKLQRGLEVNAVICDIEMPRLDGYGFLEEVKGNKAYKHLPVMMLTSRSNEKHRKVAMNLGAIGYFSKPFNEQQLLEKLSQVINI